MGTRVADRVDDWAERSFAGGYRGLQELGDREFSGVVRASGTELYITRGVAVGVRHGTVEDFDAGGTAREAPSPALPLLAVMQERDTEVRDRFYSEQTPISEVDETLADGGFTGYIELSENVLSGDYYVIYHRGRSMTVGFVGNAGRLIDGEEAFETADDEVGIYEVRAADIDHIDLPAPVDNEDTGETETDDGSPAPGLVESPDTDETTGDDPLAATTTGPQSASTDPGPAPDETAVETEGVAATESDTADDTDAEAAVTALERQAIPSLDPARTSDEHSAAGATPGPEGEGSESVDRSLAELAAALDDRESEIERLETELADARTERDDLREQLASVREERDNLAAEVERLETALAADDPGETDQERSPDEVLAGTDIFVRYESKGAATLEDAKNQSLDRRAVAENLRLEKHAGFERDHTTVDGEPYAAFIEGRLEYRFVEWVVHELLFEIRETGHQSALADLYDVLPKLDRADLAGVVETGESEDSQTETFDVVFRSRMGTPLLVANLNASREAATAQMVKEVITAAERVGKTAPEFSGAVLVTESFFEPAALEVADEATQGGLFSRDKRESFVNLSRKRGYHLCLVEAREENFHLAVPDL